MSPKMSILWQSCPIPKRNCPGSHVPKVYFVAVMSLPKIKCPGSHVPKNVYFVAVMSPAKNSAATAGIVPEIVHII